jgi:hypothetical protein
LPTRRIGRGAARWPGTDHDNIIFFHCYTHSGYILLIPHR